MARLLKPALVGLLLVAGALAPAQPADATAESDGATISGTSEKCSGNAGSFGSWIEMCIQRSTVPGDDVVRGQARALGRSYASMTIGVQQCRTVNGPCGTVSANRGQVGPDQPLNTSWKTVAYGHYYRTCGSGFGLVNVCSPWLAVPL